MIARAAVFVAAAAWLTGCQTPAYTKAGDTAHAMAVRTCTLPAAAPSLPTEVWAVKSNQYVVRVSCAMPTSELVDGKVVTRPATDANWSVYMCEGATCRKLDDVADWSKAAPVVAKPAEPESETPATDAPAAGDSESAPVADPTPAKPAPVKAGEAEIRAALDARSGDILACVQADRALVKVALAAESLSIGLTGDLAGGAEEGCVRAILADVPVPADAVAPLTVMHLVRKASSDAQP